MGAGVRMLCIRTPAPIRTGIASELLGRRAEAADFAALADAVARAIGADERAKLRHANELSSAQRRVRERRFRHAVGARNRTAGDRQQVDRGAPSEQARREQVRSRTSQSGRRSRASRATDGGQVRRLGGVTQAAPHHVLLEVLGDGVGVGVEAVALAGGVEGEPGPAPRSATTRRRLAAKPQRRRAGKSLRDGHERADPHRAI